jgi:hypothetical protein
MDWIKYGNPVINELVLALFFGTTFLPDVRPPSSLVRAIILALMALRLGYWFLLERPLADVVEEVGDQLLVRRRNIDVRIHPGEIDRMVRRRFPAWVELHFTSQTALGDRIAFVPVGSVVGQNPVLDKLASRFMAPQVLM